MENDTAPKGAMLYNTIINGQEYQILDTTNFLNDIICQIVKIEGNGIIQLGMYNNFGMAKDFLDVWDGRTNVGKKVKIKVKNDEDFYIGEIIRETYGDQANIGILGKQEKDNIDKDITIPKYDSGGNALIEKFEFII
jgi:hypothetical protein